MKVEDIYVQYHIMPSLRTHQYRVAGVAQSLCDALHIVDDNIIAACLLHDMGNILKFKLDLFPDFLEPEGLDYWKKVKADYHRTYGDDEHSATMIIAKEVLGAFHGSEKTAADMQKNYQKMIKPSRVIELIDAIGFSNAQYNFESSDIGRKIAAYSDMRVEPYGVTSLNHRLKDGHKRFKLQKPEVSNDVFFNEMSEFLKKIEHQLFSALAIKPADITEQKVQSYIKALREFNF